MTTPVSHDEVADQKKEALLKQFAQATHTRLLTNQKDLDSKDSAMPIMYDWCKNQGSIVVLKSASILSSDPTSRAVQNCKSVLLSKGIHPGHVFVATDNLITILLTKEHEEQKQKTLKSEATNIFSDQQQQLRELVFRAIAEEASDIHIEVRQNKTKVRMRQHGELHLFAEWTEKMGREIASVAFNKETDHATSHFNPLVPQDASMPLKVHGKNIRLRLASVPAHGGFDMVMRVLATGEEKIDTLASLGYTPAQIEIISNAMQLPHGAIIVSGPTGSGKTTTLASCMEMVEEIDKLYSIEDPIEKVVEKATQVPVNTEKEDRDFASMGKAALRMDPDIIILGEMRDEETARVMVRASITGHLVLTTLHTNRAPAIITRLVDMGVSPVLLSDSSVLRCLICQRLAAKICKKCALPIHKSEKHNSHFARWEAVFGKEAMKNIFVRGPGCEACGNTGVSGRTVIAEVIWVDEQGRQFIQSGDTLGWEKYLKQQGWQDYFAHATRLVKEGVCDPFDAEKIVGPISVTAESSNYRY